MSTISQISSTTAGQTGTSQATSSQATAAADTTKESVAESVEKAEVQISTRAQKLQKLAEEFFPGGPGTLEITPDFIQRLQDYGFLSQSQVDSLPDSLKTGVAASSSAQLSKLMSDSQSLLDKLDDQEQSQSLFEALGKVQQELKRFDQSGSVTSSDTAGALVKQLSEQMDSDVASQLSDAETQLVKDMAVSLKLISSFSTKSEAVKGVDSYLANNR